MLSSVSRAASRMSDAQRARSRRGLAVGSTPRQTPASAGHRSCPLRRAAPEHRQRRGGAPRFTQLRQAPPASSDDERGHRRRAGGDVRSRGTIGFGEEHSGRGVPTHVHGSRACPASPPFGETGSLGETGSSRSARVCAIALVRLRRRRAGSGRLLRRLCDRAVRTELATAFVALRSRRAAPRTIAARRKQSRQGSPWRC